jgi:hypothetical protein
MTQTIAYYALEGVARELIRTTSLLERTNPRDAQRGCRRLCLMSKRSARGMLY